MSSTSINITKRNKIFSKIVQVGVSRSITNTDYDSMLECVNATGISLTIENDTVLSYFEVGEGFNLTQDGDGTVGLLAGSGVTLKSEDNLTDIFAKYVTVTVVKLESNVWGIYGKLA